MTRKRSKEIRVMCSESEMTQITTEADRRGLSLPNFFRMIALEATSREVR